MILKKGLQLLQQNPNINDISNLLYLKEIPVNYLFLLKNFKLDRVGDALTNFIAPPFIADPFVNVNPSKTAVLFREFSNGKSFVKTLEV